MRRANTCDWALKLLNEEITSDIHTHNQIPCKEHLDAYWDNMHNTDILQKTIHRISNRAPPPALYTFITFNYKITTTPKHIVNCFTKQFTNTVKHATHKSNRSINSGTENTRKSHYTHHNSGPIYNKQSKNNNSQGPGKLNIRHLKHIGPLGLAFLTALNNNKTPHIWKLANIVPIPNPTKT